MFPMLLPLPELSLMEDILKQLRVVAFPINLQPLEQPTFIVYNPSIWSVVLLLPRLALRPLLRGAFRLFTIKIVDRQRAIRRLIAEKTRPKTNFYQGD